MPRARRRARQAEQLAQDTAEEDLLETLDIDFDFNQLTEEDYHAVSLFLKGETWAFIEDLNYGGLADCICEQGNIGTVVRTNMEDKDDEMIVGLVTVLNMRQFSKQTWLKSIEKAILAKAKKHAAPDVLKSLETLLAKRGKGAEVGLLFCERAVNLPPDCIAPLFKAVEDDINWSCTTPECPEDERPYYFFSHFIGIARCGKPAPPPEDDEESETPARKRPRKSTSQDELEWAHFEDECLLKRATASFQFPMPVAKGDREFTHEKRTIFVVTRQAFQEAAKELAAAVQAGPPAAAAASAGALEASVPATSTGKKKKAKRRAK